MRISCGVPRQNVPLDFIKELKDLGVPVIVTPSTVRVVYEGTKRQLGKKIVELFEALQDSSIYADFGQQELSAKQKHALRQKGK